MNGLGGWWLVGLGMVGEAGVGGVVEADRIGMVGIEGR